MVAAIVPAARLDKTANQHVEDLRAIVHWRPWYRHLGIQGYMSAVRPMQRELRAATGLRLVRKFYTSAWRWRQP